MRTQTASVAVCPVLRPDARWVPVDVADEGLLAVVDHLDRTVRVQRQHRPVDLHGEVLTPAERSPDSRQVDADLLRREAEAGRDLVAVDVQPLGRDVDVHPSLAVRHSEPGFWAEERLILDSEVVDACDGKLPADSGSPWRMIIERTTFGLGSSR